MSDVASLYRLLECSVGFVQGLAEQKAAMKELERATACLADGFVSSLVHIAQHTSSSAGVRLECRQLAVITLKNVVEKSWAQRGGSIAVVSDGDKEGLRQFVLSQWLEPDRKVARQLRALTAKIARKDWPAKWPTLIPVLFQSATTTSSAAVGGDESTVWMQQSRVMSTLLCVLEELSQKTLANHKHELSQAALDMFVPLEGVWQSLLEQLSSYIDFSSQSMQQLGQPQFVGVPRSPRHEFLAAHLAVTTKTLMLVLQKAFSALSKQTGILAHFFDLLVSHLPRLVRFLRLGKKTLGRGGQGTNENDDDDEAEAEAEADANALADADAEDSGYEIDDSQDAEEGDAKLAGVRTLIPSLNKVVKAGAALPPALLKDHPLEMAHYLAPFLTFYYDQLVEEYVSSGEGWMGRPTTLQPLYVSSVLFLSNTLHCQSYSANGVENAATEVLRSKELMREILDSKVEALTAGHEPPTANVDAEARIAAAATAAAAQGAAIKHAFFTPERVTSILDLVLHRLLCYSTGELAEWANSPEQFVLGQDGITEGDTVKSTAEMFLTALLDANVSPCADVAAAKIIGHLNSLPQQLEAVREGASDESVMFWDAVYLSTGLGNFYLGDKINADEWLTNVIGPLLTAMLASPSAGSLRRGPQLLRTRLLWLIKSWLYLFNPSVFEQLLPFLVQMLEPASGSDVVVCVETVRLVEFVIDSSTFDPIVLVPLLLRLFEALCALTCRLEDNELQAPVVLLMDRIINCAGPHAVPLLLSLAEHLWGLWNSSGASSSPVRTSVVECFEQMVRTAGPLSVGLHGVVGPVVVYALSGTEESAYLFKEGLELLLAVMRNCGREGYSEALAALLPACLHSTFAGGECVCSDASDFRTVMLICEAYLLVDGPRCLFSCGAALGGALLKLVGLVAARNVAHILRPLDALFLSCPAEAGPFLLDSGLLLSILRICSASVPQFQAFLEKHKYEDVALVSYLSIVARLLLCNMSVLVTAAQRLAAELAPALGPAVDHNEILRCVARLMIDKFDSVGYCTGGVWRRKLWCLALLSLYPHTEIVRPWFSEVCDVAVDVLAEEATEEGAEKRANLVQALVGCGNRHTDADFGEDDENHGYGDGDGDEGSPPTRQPEAVVTIFEGLFNADIVARTSVEQALQATTMSMMQKQSAAAASNG
jgi:hypothetical protein